MTREQWKTHVAASELALGEDRTALIRALALKCRTRDPERVADLWIGAAHKWGYERVLKLLVKKATERIAEDPC